jgi:hypothetical protein
MPTLQLHRNLTAEDAEIAEEIMRKTGDLFAYLLRLPASLRPLRTLR